MVSRSIFELRVGFRAEDQTCPFELSWPNAGGKLYRVQKYSDKLQAAYETWKQCYFNHIQPNSVQEEEDSGSGRIRVGDLGDSSMDVRDAEKSLLETFRRWIGEGEARDIERQLQLQLTSLVHHSSQRPQGGKENSIGIDIYLSCDRELEKLPWEAWLQWLNPNEILPNSMRIIRTSQDAPEGFAKTQTVQKDRRTRVLAVIGYDPGMPMDKDWEVLQTLKDGHLVDLELLRWKVDASPQEISKIVFDAISDDRGWDVLFFAGHSDEASHLGGTFNLTPRVKLSIHDLTEHLKEATKNGLELAIFNSCCGLDIARALMQFGIQAVVMREPIHNDVALVFLRQLCQKIRLKRDIYDALSETCRYLKKTEQFRFPSSYLVPSFYSPPKATPFQFQEYGLRRWLKQWKPTRKESRTLIAFTLISLFFWPVQDVLLDFRFLSQLWYRQITSQGIETEPSPEIYIVGINQASINAYKKDKEPSFRVHPIERRYLAELIDKASEENVKTLGINYFIISKEVRQELLNQSIKNSIQERQTWMILAEPDTREVQSDSASPNWTLHGKVYYDSWYFMSLPKEPDCITLCPFSYLISTSHRLTQINHEALPQPDLASREDFKTSVFEYLDDDEHDFPSLHSSPVLRRLFNNRHLVDFSIPPGQVYQRISSESFRNDGLSGTELNNKIVLIGASGYEDSTDEVSYPLAVELSRWNQSTDSEESQEFPQDIFTGTEREAYLIHNQINQHFIKLVPEYLIVLLAAGIGKGTTLFCLNKSASKYHPRFLVSGIVIYGLISLQLYIAANLVFSWFLPSTVFVLSTLPIFRRTTHE